MRQFDLYFVPALPIHLFGPPPLTPPLKGEGDETAAISTGIAEVFGPDGAVAGFPSPLRGGVGGGGNPAGNGPVGLPCFWQRHVEEAPPCN